MTKYSMEHDHGSAHGSRPSVDELLPPAQRGGTCDLYQPGHQIHYRHQGDAVRSPARAVVSVLLDGTALLLALDDGTERVWRHHDPERLRRILELLRGTCVAYPEHHALRVGPYWFNCATDTDRWQECRVSAVHRTA